MKSLVTVREGSPANWAMRIVGVALVLGVLLWIAGKGSPGLQSDVTTAFIFMAILTPDPIFICHFSRRMEDDLAQSLRIMKDDIMKARPSPG